jgi:hypothetical protein
MVWDMMLFHPDVSDQRRALIFRVKQYSSSKQGITHQVTRHQIPENFESSAKLL